MVTLILFAVGLGFVGTAVATAMRPLPEVDAFYG